MNYVQGTLDEGFSVEERRHPFKKHLHASTAMVQVAPRPQLSLDKRETFASEKVQVQVWSLHFHPHHHWCRRRQKTEKEQD